jgi:hypothetical protein
MSQQSDERRDSDRVPFRFQVRERAQGGSFEEHLGNLSLGGVYFAGYHPPVGVVVELRFILPDHEHEVEAVGEVLRVSRDGHSSAPTCASPRSRSTASWRWPGSSRARPGGLR